MTSEEREQLDAALRIHGACIWCRQENTHSKGCLVADALSVLTSPPVWELAKKQPSSTKTQEKG